MTSSKDQEKLPFGVLTKKQIDRKFCYVLSVEPKFLKNKSFKKGLENDLDKNQYLRFKQQLHYEILQEADAVDLELEQGGYQTFYTLLSDNPAIVAKSGFVDNVVAELMDGLEQMHAQSAYHLCLAPQNLLIRKGDEMPMMLIHASSFSQTFVVDDVFADYQTYIAPEVLEGEPMSARSDIFSLGCFIRYLFEQGSVPYEYKCVIEKATQRNPEKRYESIGQMRADLAKRRSLKNSVLSFVAAFVVVLLCVGLYFEMMPEAEDVEFIEPAPKEEENILFDGSFNPDDSINMEILTDSGVLDTVTMEQRKVLDLYIKKSEDIFRRQFAKEADRVMTKMYSRENMSASENKFISSNNAMRNELLKIQNDLIEQSGISDEAAGRISLEVIEMLTKQKQQQMNNYKK